MEEKYMWLRC